MPDEPQATITILNVNDDDANRYAVTWMLRRAGFSVEEATTGLEALRKAAQGPDLIVLDIKLPDVNGFEVCQRLKADPATVSIPVLHLSANFIRSRDRTQGLDGGADGYLVQPVEPTELIATVKALLRARRAEENARAAAAQWQATFDAIADGVCLLDRSGTILRCNRAMAHLVGRESAASLVGLAHNRLMQETFGPFESLDPAGPRSAGRQGIRELQAAGRWFRLTADPVHDDRGEPAGLVLVLADLTPRKRLEEELRRHAHELTESDRSKDEFLAMLAHELRNPLAPIHNAVQILRLRGDDPEIRNRMRQMIEAQVGNLTRLVDDLLDVSRITRGKIQLRPEPVDLAEVVARAIETARGPIDLRGHALTVTLPPVPVPLEADPTRLEQILVNLLNNAAKYTEPGGSITLSAEQDGTELVIRVHDSGVGIAPEMPPRVFDLFAQADRSLDRTQGGLGIGLTLVRSLVELHRGSVAALSPGQGQGSEFVVRLPLPSPIETPTGVEPAPAETAAPPGTLRVLVVDDNIPSAQSLALLLKLWGHEVHLAHDGPSAFTAALELCPEAILLDIGLPGMDGYNLARKLRQESTMKPVLLVAMTGYALEEDRRLAHEAGFDHHLAKPIDLSILEDLLSQPHSVPPRVMRAS